MDLLLGPFADARLHSLSPAELAVYETLLSENDHDLYFWIAGRGPAPEPFSEIVAKIRAFRTPKSGYRDV